MITLLTFWLTLNAISDRRWICDGYLVREFFVNKELPVTSLSALTKRGDYASFSPAAEAKFHRGIISGTSSCPSNKYVSVVYRWWTGMQTVPLDGSHLTHIQSVVYWLSNSPIQRIIMELYSSTLKGCFLEFQRYSNNLSDWNWIKLFLPHSWKTVPLPMKGLAHLHKQTKHFNMDTLQWTTWAEYVTSEWRRLEPMAFPTCPGNIVQGAPPKLPADETCWIFFFPKAGSLKYNQAWIK